MKLFNLLSRRGNYYILMEVAIFEILNKIQVSNQESEKISLSIMDELLDYLQKRPEKILKLESQDYEKMMNDLKRIVKKRVYVMLRKRKY